VPDITFLLDCPVGVSLARLGQRVPADAGGPDAVERYDGVTQRDHERRRTAYLDLLARDPDRYVLIDAAGSPEAMVAAAWTALEGRFGRL
jgi:dTMP kinase